MDETIIANSVTDDSSPAPTPRARVRAALRHEQPDRVPVDFAATPEVWAKLIKSIQPDTSSIGPSAYFEPAREAVLRHLQVDCRVLSYDMFCNPPGSALNGGSVVDWWSTLNRSTPNRMWRQRNGDGTFNDIWGTHSRVVDNPYGSYEEFASWPLGEANTVEQLRDHPWPEPDWWDFSPLPDIIEHLGAHDTYHFRFRVGSVFEIAWQLRGMERFLMDLATDPSLPVYIMDRLTEVYLENTRRVLDLAGDQVDVVYFYDDVSTQESLMMSKRMWRRCVRPYHVKLADLAHAYGKLVMYHCDGAVYPLIPELIDLGVDILNPVQPDAKGMDLASLKRDFGDQLSFHGGVDIRNVLPHGTPEEVAAAVRECVGLLGPNGGYILCSAHHIQPDTPVENVLAMHELDLRYPLSG
jgi:uroporphyrinogen decarboxylase